MKDNKILYGIVVTFIFLLSIGLTYAYFTTVEVGQGSEVTASVGTLSVLYTDGPEIVAENIHPGWTTTKTVKVKNTGSLKAYYSLVWSSITNEITNDELILSATCASNIGSCDNISTQVANEDIVYGKPLLQNEEHTYTITFLFKETGSSQNYNQDKKFNGVLSIIEATESNTIVGQLLDSNGNPINGATVEMHSTLRTGKTDSRGNFTIRGVEVGNHEVTVKNSSNSTIATDSLSIASGSSLGVSNKNITGITDKGLINTSIKLNNSNTIEEIKVYPSLKDKILTDNTVYADNVSSPYVTSSTGIDFKAKSTLTNGQGLYTNKKLEDGKNTYFRGGSYCAYTDYTLEDLTGTKCTAAGGTWNYSNYKCSLDLNRATCQTKGFTYYDLKNNVTFAGHKWKIIRIDENNNIRMILADDSVSSTTFNANYNDNAHVGYMYGNSTLFQETTTSTPSSIAIGATDTYYYGTSYAKNGSNQYYLTGTMTSGIWNTAGICTSGSCLVANYYTCKSTSSSGVCSTLYKITSWNSATNANAYTTTYASQSYNQAHTNTINSTIKTAVDTWYSSNLINYTNYLTDAGYCSDRSLTSGLGYGTGYTQYKGYTRNYPDTTASPRLSVSANCSNPTRDLFTTKDSTVGNKMLTYPIGLITADEARYAGMIYYGETSTQYNFTNYLKYNGWYWTISPMLYSLSSLAALEYYVGPRGNFDNNYLSATYGLRASVSLKSSTSVLSGSGTYDNPYVIE